jgi:hypothetical protein
MEGCGCLESLPMSSNPVALSLSLSCVGFKTFLEDGFFAVDFFGAGCLFSVLSLALAFIVLD